MRIVCGVALTALGLVGCGASDDETETVTLQDQNGNSYSLSITASGSNECFELDHGRLGEWCGDPVGDVRAVQVIGSAGSGVQPDGGSGVEFEYAVVGVAPLDADSVRVSLDDETQVVPATPGERYSAWVSMFSSTVTSDRPLGSPSQPSITAEVAG